MARRPPRGGAHNTRLCLVPAPTCSDGGVGKRPGLTEHLHGRRGIVPPLGIIAYYARSQ